MSAVGSLVAVVPLKTVGEAKSRLGGLLDAGAREALTAWMLSRVVAACRDSLAVDEVLVVAGDRAGADLAADEGVPALVQPRAGLAAAMATADRAVGGAAASLVVMADLPLARAEDLDAVWAASRRGGHGACGGEPAGDGRVEAGGRAEPACVVVAPTWDGGTAVLLRRPPDVVATVFGRCSAAGHHRAAAAAGVRAVRVDRARLALDVDTPAALRAVAGVEPDARRWLER